MNESAERPFRWRFGAPFEWALLVFSIYALVALPGQRWLAGAAAIQAASFIGMARALSAESLQEPRRSNIAGSLFVIRWAAGCAMLLTVLIQLAN